jgi:type IV pilus assembly protein PilF
MMRHVGRPGLLALLLVCALLEVQPAEAQSGQPTDRQSLQDAAAINAQLSLTYLKQGNLQAAREKIEKALQQSPDTAETQMAAGFVYDRLGEDKRALGHFDRAVKLAKGDPDILNNAAVFLCRKGERKRGEQYFLKAAASPLYRTPEIAYTNAGNCAQADGRAKDAEAYFRKALNYNPKLADALLPMAELMQAAGNSMQARAFLQRFLSGNPATAEALWVGYGIERSLGDEAQAAEYAQRLRSEFSNSEEAVRLFEAERGKP